MRCALLLYCCLLSLLLHAQQGGQPDLTFGSGGKIIVDVDALDHCSGAFAFTDGSTILYGQTGMYNGHIDQDALFVKLDASGNLDPTFGNGGIVRFDFPNQHNSRVEDAVAYNNAIYFIGESNPNTALDTQTVFIGKLSANGLLDPQFGTQGYYTEQWNTPFNLAGAIAMDGNNIVFGATIIDTAGIHTEYPVMGRLLPLGIKDPAFGGSGVLTWSAYTGLQSAYAPMPQLYRHSDGAQLNDLLLWNGQYLYSGFYYIGETTVGFLLLVNSDGTAGAWGNNGALIVDLSPGYPNFITTAFAMGDTLMLAGQSDTPNGTHLFHAKKILNNGMFLENETYDFQGNQNQLKAACFDNEHLYMAGYTKLSTSNGVGYESDFFGVVAANTQLAPATNFDNQGYGTYNFPIQEETGATAITTYGNDRLLIAGYVEPTDPNNFIDIGVMRCYKVQSPNNIHEWQQAELSVYPNPATDQLYIDGAYQLPYAIYATTGQLLQQGTASGNIAIAQLPAGIYLLQLPQQTIRFVKH